MTQSKPQRLFLLDALRVFAIVMMIAYHFVYDLRYFGYVDWNTPLGNGVLAMAHGHPHLLYLCHGYEHGNCTWPAT